MVKIMPEPVNGEGELSGIIRNFDYLILTRFTT